MTDWTPRELPLPLTFLPAGTFTAAIWQDGPNAARYGSDWQRVERRVTASDTLRIKMAAGGGWVARLALAGSDLESTVSSRSGPAAPAAEAR